MRQFPNGYSEYPQRNKEGGLAMTVVLICMLVLIIVAVIAIMAAYRISMAKIDCHTETIASIPIAPYTFSIGDRIRLKGNTYDSIGHCIVDIHEGYYWCDADITIPHSCQGWYEKF